MASVKFFFKFLLLVALTSYSFGCSLATDLLISSIDNKINMDRTGETPAPIDVVYDATQLAIKDLNINLEKKEFDGKEAYFEASVGELDYVRIYLYQLTPTSTKVAVQARTALMPATQHGYDYAFAKKIMDTIGNDINKVVAGEREEDKTYTCIDKKPTETKAADVDLIKYVEVPQGLSIVYDLKNVSENGQASGKLFCKYLGPRNINNKNTYSWQIDLSNTSTGKQSFLVLIKKFNSFMCYF